MDWFMLWCDFIVEEDTRDENFSYVAFLPQMYEQGLQSSKKESSKKELSKKESVKKEPCKKETCEINKEPDKFGGKSWVLSIIQPLGSSLL